MFSSYFLRRIAAADFSPAFSTLVITQNFRVWRLLPFALKGLWILAGGGTTGNRTQTARTPTGVLDGTLNYEIFHHRASVPRPAGAQRQ